MFFFLMLSTDASSVEIKDGLQALITSDKAQLHRKVSRYLKSFVSKLHLHPNMIDLRLGTQTRLQHLPASLDLCSCLSEQSPNNVTVSHRDRTV